jgi:hypothetical protein
MQVSHALYSHAYDSVVSPASIPQPKRMAWWFSPINATSGASNLYVKHTVSLAITSQK